MRVQAALLRLDVKSLQQMWEQSGGDGAKIEGHTVIYKPRDAKPSIAAHIDALERLKVERHIQRHAVVTRATPDAQADARQLGALHIHAGRSARALCRDA